LIPTSRSASIRGPSADPNPSTEDLAPAPFKGDLNRFQDSSIATRGWTPHAEGGSAVAEHITLVVNGQQRELEVEPRRLLVQVLREDLGLTGTHVGCDTSQCGACTVHLDGAAVKSCTVLAVQADGGSVTTIEGLATNGELHPLQAAFRKKHGLQCGFCTPGMIMTAADLLAHQPDPSDDEIRHSLEGNICRCTGYHNIVAAVREASATVRRETSAPTETAAAAAQA
jgi:carbon-monoxide dehydrogenase small subunit